MKPNKLDFDKTQGKETKKCHKIEAPLIHILRNFVKSLN